MTLTAWPVVVRTYFAAAALRVATWTALSRGLAIEISPHLLYELHLN